MKHTLPRLRAYRASDLSALIALFRAAVRELASRDYDLRQRLAWAPDVIDAERFEARLASCATWVAEIAGRQAGFGSVETDGHIDLLYVHPDFARRGVARLLLEHIENEAKRGGIVRLYAEVSLTARAVFGRCGFRELARQTVVVRGVSMDNYRMDKVITAS